tara:strand:- start:43 stop:255 length:213 start_codon:yes stop_codon:yes gene_type:complete
MAVRRCWGAVQLLKQRHQMTPRAMVAATYGRGFNLQYGRSLCHIASTEFPQQPDFAKRLIHLTEQLMNLL